MSGQVALSWAPVSNADTYNLYQDGVAIWSGPGMGFTVNGLTNDVAYSFSLTATGPGGTSAASSATSATPEAVPGAPTGLSATVADSSTVVSWAAPTGTFSAQLPLSYTLYQDDMAVQSAISGTSASVSGLSDGTSYSFEVTATDSYGQTSASSASTAVTPIGAPLAPSGVTSTEANDNVTVAWTSPATTAAPGNRVLHLPRWGSGRDHLGHFLGRQLSGPGRLYLLGGGLQLGSHRSLGFGRLDNSDGGAGHTGHTGSDPGQWPSGPCLVF